MSKPKEARERLFRHGKPDIRPMQESDLAVLWAAYKLSDKDDPNSMKMLGEMDQHEFTDEMLTYIAGKYAAWMVEDTNTQYGDGYGPVGMVVASFNGWEMEPHLFPFPWATAKNRMKTVVGFMMKARYEKGVGVLNLYAREHDMEFFSKIGKKYGVMYYVGKVPKGLYGDNKYYFYGRGGSYFKGIDDGRRS